MTDTSDNVSFEPLRNESKILFQKGSGLWFAASVGDGCIDFDFGSTVGV